MKNVLMVVPTTRTGGIVSWAKKIINNFPQNQYKLTIVNNAPAEGNRKNIFWRVYSGLITAMAVYRQVISICRSSDIAIMHTATSGGMSSFRDYIIGRYCKQRGIKTILHCHYGNMNECLARNDVWQKLLYLAMKQYDQIWVLDSKTKNCLENDPKVISDVFIVPNSISAHGDITIKPKAYKNIVFLANLVPEKGLFEVTEAVSKSSANIVLHIVGNGLDSVKQRIKDIAANKYGTKIIYHGGMDNESAVKFLSGMDILALPSYMGAEAFPISILEAMSLGKLVISTRRAAIPDMLTSADGQPCGVFVEERSSQSIVEAIDWIHTHKQEADEMCKRAYQRIITVYNEKTVYALHEKLYTMAVAQ